MSANVLVATCPITEECPVPRNTKTKQSFGSFWLFQSKMVKHGYLNWLLVTTLKLIKCQCLGSNLPQNWESVLSKKTAKLIRALVILDHFSKQKKRQKGHLNILLGKTSKKKAAFFWTLSKSGIDPPPHFGHLWGNFCYCPFWTSVR